MIACITLAVKETGGCVLRDASSFFILFRRGFSPGRRRRAGACSEGFAGRGKIDRTIRLQRPHNSAPTTARFRLIDRTIFSLVPDALEGVAGPLGNCFRSRRSFLKTFRRSGEKPSGFS
ncbi:hypothetical protein BACCOPRO_01260 [Phocaeicola coprophilus DSM 18228 = JCM 13818]|uniref:Uncharacterized protein n=1 Tax=Phocaeicola coprophilus DSM 18228 = JCM 13818 TaxID=547042 RepID=S0F694_9BACT|nr:hypothetical protein BACCOPRO_01260 [Phocaeicola coprophilus DSM 18228 = JCM 13818]